jgi:diacylglycerol kinase family enzyme
VLSTRAGSRLSAKPASEQPGVRRAAAITALVLPPLMLGLAVAVMVQEFPRVLVVVALLLIGLAAAWYGLLRRGVARALGFGIGILALAAMVIGLVRNGDHIDAAIVIVGGLALAAAAAKAAFSSHVRLPEAPTPKRPVLFYNPESGGGKAEKFHLAEEARKRGIEPVELEHGTDLEQLVCGAVADGADALAMAGGDGSQAVVAAVAAELDLPYSCIPAGTRNHFALDLGVDRNDVVGALDALGADGGERRVDLGEVNGRIFVNNVSLGLYAEAVQREGYREAKIRTILDTLPEVLGPEGRGHDLRWTDPGGEERSSSAAILVSNNRYRLGRAVGSGTRPSMDQGALGITVADAPAGDAGGRRSRRRPWREWSTSEFIVSAEAPIAAGVDGEAMTLEAPLRFRSRPGALRVRVSAEHPGASPSARIPEGSWEGVRALARIAAGRDPATD